MRLLSPKDTKNALAQQKMAMHKEGSETIAALQHGQRTLNALRDEIAKLAEEKEVILLDSMRKYQELVTPLEDEVKALQKRRDDLLQPVDAIIADIKEKQAQVDQLLAATKEREADSVGRVIALQNKEKSLVSREEVIRGQEQSTLYQLEQSALKLVSAKQIEEDTLERQSTILANLDKRTKEQDNKDTELKIRELAIETKDAMLQERQRKLEEAERKLRIDQSRLKALYGKRG